MGINSIHPQKGLAIRQYEESLLKQKMMSVAKKTVSCVIEEKMNRVENYKVCDVDDLDYLVTSLNPNEKILQPFKGKSVEIL
jgi:DeoR/GlpR family transcriptional regulator of sugar metabolism